MDFRRRISVYLCFILLWVCCFVPTKVVKAEKSSATDNAGWTQMGKEWHISDADGNELIAKLVGRKLRITGNGAIPNYNKDCLGNRPWDKLTYYSLEIGEGVTSIGSYAFANNEYLRDISFYSKAFVDATAFKAIAYGANFTVRGTDIATKKIGNLPYTSMDSIAYFIQENNGTMNVQLDNSYMVSLTRNKSSWPELKNVYTLDYLSTYADAEHPVLDCTSTITLASGEKANLTIQQKLQGELANEVFGAVIGDYHYVAAYNLTMTDIVGNAKTLSDTTRFVMTVPVAYQAPGRQFRLIGIGAGEILLLDDLDADDTTITFDTKHTSTCYALVYKDIM